jgi:DNA ligase-1
MGELRQGASEGVVLDAVALASGLPASDVRRAAMLRGSTAAVGGALLGAAIGGAPLDDTLELFRPVKPMLAQTADGVEDALERLGEAAFEVKFDGARVQVHRSGDDVRVFTRRLNDETASLPEVVEGVRALPVREIVLDGEAIGLKPDGTPRAFQETMTRFGRKRDLDGARASVPLTTFFFDVLHLDGTSLIDRPAVERWQALESVVPSAARAPRVVTRDAAVADALLRDARARGHEGLMAKALDAPYVAGRRGSAWLKVKPSFSADLVVLAAEWGHGRRTGWLSNLHLGARGSAPGEWVMVGKTFKGMTDALLAWQTERLLALAEKEAKHVVRVRPELVVEIAFDGVQASPRYAGGLALRFARVKGYREDKTPAEADSAAWLAEIRDRWG